MYFKCMVLYFLNLDLVLNLMEFFLFCYLFDYEYCNCLFIFDNSLV